MIPPVLQDRHANWTALEAAIAALPTTKERGDALEAFAYFYLRYFRVEQEVLGEPEFPVITGRAFSKAVRDQLLLDTRDYGIDGVFRRVDATLTAVQCKFRTDRLPLSYTELSTFWSEAYKADYHLVFTNAIGVTQVARRREKHLAITVEQLLALDPAFFEALYQFASAATEEIVRPAKKEPRPYQDSALEDILRGLEENDRGKLTAACGIGKTLIALWVVERRNDRRVIFIAPNLQLIRQTLKEWSIEATDPFRFIAVCSDTDVASDVDEMHTDSADADVRTTTDPRVIAEFLRNAPETQRTVVFSTYQSLPRVVESLAATPTFTFDIALFDEAHRTAGANLATGFSVGLDDTKLRSRKRLFMTATERLFAPRAIAKAEDSGVVLLSMDSVEDYGPTFHSLSFRKAIEEKIICDYDIVVAAVPEREVQEKLASSLWLTDEHGNQEPVESTAVVAALSISRASAQLGTRKVVSFHSTVRSARRLAETPLTDYLSPGLRDHAYHVNGTMSPGLRAQTLSDFANAEQSLLTNARCLVEGVDIPIIDGVCFVTPKTSMIDIVQAVGRAVRKPWGVQSEKVARVLVPVVVADDDADGFDDAAFAGVFNVVQALREQDEALAQTVDEWNLRISRGDRPTDGGGGLITWVTVDAVESLDLDALRESLELRIATVNARPGEHLSFVPPLGTGERGSSVERLVRTMADYTPEKLDESLIRPTMDRFAVAGDVLSAADLRINNNNVAHARKLGVTRQVGDREAYALTSLGKQLRAGDRSFDDILRNQLLLYEEPKEKGLFPYRLVGRFVAERGRMRYWDFLFGIYNAEPATSDEERIARAWARVDMIDRYYDSLERANEASKAVLLDELNTASGLSLRDADVWTDRTTAANQFRYFGRHLAMYGEVFEFPQVRPFWRRALSLASGEAAETFSSYLARSSEGLNSSYGDFYWWSE